MHALLHRGHADGYWGRSEEPRRMSFPSRGSTSHIMIGASLLWESPIREFAHLGNQTVSFFKTGRLMRRTQVLTSKFYPGSLFSCFRFLCKGEERAASLSQIFHIRPSGCRGVFWIFVPSYSGLSVSYFQVVWNMGMLIKSYPPEASTIKNIEDSWALLKTEDGQKR